MAGQRNSYGKRSHSHSDYADRGANKRRSAGDDRENFSIDSEDTVYRYLCPGRKIGSIIGRGGDIVKQLRAETKSKIRIGDTVSGSDERVVTIYSSSDETNPFEDTDTFVSPSQDALFKVHDRVAADEALEESHQVTARLLVPSDQIGSVIGKGGQIVQNIRTESGAQIRILKDDHLPSCALSSDELVQISGEPSVVKKALFQIALRLHENPSRSQHMLTSAMARSYSSVAPFMGPGSGTPIMGLAPLVSSYGGYKRDGGDWPRALYSGSRDEASSKEFSIRIVCPAENIGGVIGKNGIIINQIRQESGAHIKVDSSTADGDECLILLSAKEFFESASSPVIEAAVRLQPRCSDKSESDSGVVFTIRLLVPTARIGCLIGRKGSIITEIRKSTKANIRIPPREELPKVASEDDELVQISGELDVAKDALVQIMTRLRANLFDREAPAFVPVLPYVPMPTDVSDGMRHGIRDSKRHGREHSYSDGYGGPSDLAPIDSYGSYGGPQMGGSGSGYGGYGGYSSGRSNGSGYSSQAPVSRRRSYGY